MCKRVVLILYVTVLWYYCHSIVESRKFSRGVRAKLPKNLQFPSKFPTYFFTLWIFGVQTLFLCTAVLDELLQILTPKTKLQKSIQYVRHVTFSTIVFPCTLLVVTVFWTIWHIDRELIFPKALDDFYPAWLNHTMHTFILVPLVIEVAFSQTVDKYHVLERSLLGLLAFAGTYQTIYFFIYIRHGIWLYPIYGVLNWMQRIVFVLIKVIACTLYHYVGVALLTRNKTRPEPQKLL
ncbi:androgen-dependent TFPI-regulating protein-like isoform X2 [Cylas formicarius]|uniref:androgen-dependent TFPI-regulating protein-like isoform X2 n=1 Tax=Cylas formicarius TaxID=197179 RepID=UPI002958A19F|nr:androgen-dependent TFPI-regulating protein-like isoform X2 [Cylas formicarius]